MSPVALISGFSAEALRCLPMNSVLGGGAVVSRGAVGVGAAPPASAAAAARSAANSEVSAAGAAGAAGAWQRERRSSSTLRLKVSAAEIRLSVWGTPVRAGSTTAIAPGQRPAASESTREEIALSARAIESRAAACGTWALDTAGHPSAKATESMALQTRTDMLLSVA
jgi:hypothetical protein